MLVTIPFWMVATATVFFQLRKPQLPKINVLVICIKLYVALFISIIPKGKGKDRRESSLRFSSHDHT